MSGTSEVHLSSLVMQVYGLTQFTQLIALLVPKWTVLCWSHTIGIYWVRIRYWQMMIIDQASPLSMF